MTLHSEVVQSLSALLLELFNFMLYKQAGLSAYLIALAFYKRFKKPNKLSESECLSRHRKLNPYKFRRQNWGKKWSIQYRPKPFFLHAVSKAFAPRIWVTLPHVPSFLLTQHPCSMAYCKTRNGLWNGLIPRTHRKWKYALISCRNDHFAHCPSTWTLPPTTTQS